MLFVLGIVSMLAMAGCASAPVNQAAYLPPPGLANIYVFRVEGMAQTSLALVRLDGSNVGGLGPSSYMKFTVQPGRHRVSTQLSNVVSTTVNARPGQAYYIMVSTVPGFGGPGVMQNLVTDGSGPAGVNNCRRVN